MNPEKKSNLSKRIESVLRHKATNLENAYTKSLEELIEDLKIYQYELEFQNDELQRIHHALEESKNEYMLLFQHAPVGYVILNDELTLIDCNQTFRTMVQRHAECKKKMDFRKFIDPASQDEFHLFCKGLLNGSHPDQIEVKLNVSADTNIYVNIVGRFSSHNSSRRYFLSINDITQRRMAEEQLKLSEERFRSLFNNNHAVMLLIDPETGRIEAVNSAAEKYYGWPKDKMTTMKISQINTLAPEQVFIEMQAAKAARKNHFDFKHRIADGNIRDVEVYSGVVNIKSRHLLYSIVHDVTDRRIIQEKLLKTKELLLQTSRMARVGGWEIDLTTDKAKWSDVTREIAEAAPDYEPDLAGSIALYVEGCSRETFQGVVAEAIAKGTPFDEELQIITAKENLKWVRTQGKAEFKDGKCIRIYGTFQDIDEKKKQQEILQKSEMELKELNATKDKLFSIIAHDLKSPFNSILGLSELLKEDASECEPQNILEYSKMINASATQAYNLLENLLDWARMQQGKVSILKESVDLKREVNSVFYLMNSQMEAKNITGINEVKEGFTLYADLNIAKTVLRNLISNAVKFTNPGGFVKVSASDNNGTTTVSVTDNGVGMEAEVIKKLFSPGEYYSTNGTRNEKGTGLGFTLCKEFIEKLGGAIQVESEKGKGSTFSFMIPADN
jgi:PAS domain S-box-containing protein